MMHGDSSMAASVKAALVAALDVLPLPLSRRLAHFIRRIWPWFGAA